MELIQKKFTDKHEKGVNSLELSADAGIMLSYNRKDNVGLCLWDTATADRIKTFKPELEYYDPIALLEGDRVLIEADEILQVWDYKQETKLHELKIDLGDGRPSYSCYDYYPESGQALISPGSFRPFFWNINTNSYQFCNAPFKFKDNPLKTTDGQTLYLLTEPSRPTGYQKDSSQNQNSAPAVVALDRQTGKILREYGERAPIADDYYNNDYATKLLLREDTDSLVIGYKSGLLREYDLSSGETVLTYQKKGAYIHHLSKIDRDRFISIGELDQYLSYWNGENRKKAASLPLPARRDEESDYPFYHSTNDGRFLALLNNEMRNLMLVDFEGDKTLNLDLDLSTKSARVSHMKMRGYTLYIADNKGGLQKLEISA